MGRGSDTRMYNPRSESSHMFRENHEEEGTRTGYEDPRDLDNRADKRQAKKEKEDKEERKIRHIKVRSHHLRSGQDEIDEEESPMEDSEYKPRGSVDNPSKQTIPSGAGGFLTSLATQAKGPGAAAGQLVAMSEPMLDAWSELLKQDGRIPDVTDEYDYYNYYDTYADEDRPLAHMPHSTLDARLAERGEAGEYAHDNDDEFDELIHEYLMRDRENRSGVDRGGFPQEFQDIHTSEPMENAWSELLKEDLPDSAKDLFDSEGNLKNYIGERPHQDTPTSTLHNIIDRYGDIGQFLGEEDDSWFKYDKDFLLHYLGDDFSQHKRIVDEMVAEYDGREKGFFDHVESPQAPSPVSPYYFAPKSEPMFIGDVLVKSKKEERKRKKEEGAKFRPSTGAFERPRGGFGGRPATPARAKIISRNLPVGRHTGLNLADLAVEMSHRGVASKQPMSKDPQQYRDYMATQEAQKRVGNVRTPYAEHRRFGRPSKRAKSGMPRVPRPRLHPVRAPSIVPPKMKMPRLRKPKMPGMVTMSEDEVTQSDVLKSASDAGYLRILVRELREALRETRDKDRKRKGMGTPDTSGAASNLPNHPSNSHAQTSTPQGGTENEEAEAKMYGADPAQVINARGSNKS